jgi:hypothetical protein
MGLLVAKIPSALQLVGMGVLSLVTAVGMMKLVQMGHATPVGAEMGRPGDAESGR